MRRSESNVPRRAVVFNVAMAFWLLLSETTAAMTFDVVSMKGEPAIIARGEIVAGDAARLRAVLIPKSKHSYGYYTLILESPGGSVQEAFELSRVIDSHYVNTYVAPGKRCVSACSAIVFIAGREHIAAPGAYLGFHGCFNAKNGRIESLCNEAIAKHAAAHDTAYGAVMMLIEEVPSDKVVWIIGGEADCWGINKYDITPEPANYLECVVKMVKMLQR